jgi:hypothetical protein
VRPCIIHPSYLASRMSFLHTGDHPSPPACYLPARCVPPAAGQGPSSAPEPADSLHCDKGQAERTWCCCCRRRRPRLQALPQQPSAPACHVGGSSSWATGQLKLRQIQFNTSALYTANRMPGGAMERRRSSALQGLPPAEVASVAATEALRLCGSIRAAAADVPTCRRDCR